VLAGFKKEEEKEDTPQEKLSYSLKKSLETKIYFDNNERRLSHIEIKNMGFFHSVEVYRSVREGH
jgi:hypothetical protein